MSPRKVKLSRRVAADYMLIGMALGGSLKEISAALKPNEMLTQTGSLALAAIVAKDRAAFADAVAVRLGIEIEDGESIVSSLIKHIKRTNLELSSLDIADAIVETLVRCGDLGSAEQRLSDALDVVRSAVEASKTLASQPVSKDLL